MNNIFQLKLRAVSCAVALALGLGTLASPPPARAGIPVIDYSHILQTIWNEIARLEDAWRDYQQFLRMVDSIKNIDPNQMADWAGNVFIPADQQKMMRDLVDLYSKGKSLAYTMQDLDDQFKSQFPGYEEYLKEVQTGNLDNLPTSYKELAEAGFDNARLSMKAAQLNISAFDNEDKAMQKLLRLSRGARGQVQAIQVSNEIAAQQMQQMQMMRQMVANQITLQSNWMAQQTRAEARGNALREELHMQRIENSQPKKWQVADKDQMNKDNQGNYINW